MMKYSLYKRDISLYNKLVRPNQGYDYYLIFYLISKNNNIGI